jgi:hypothetical protein
MWKIVNAIILEQTTVEQIIKFRKLQNIFARSYNIAIEQKDILYNAKFQVPKKNLNIKKIKQLASLYDSFFMAVLPKTTKKNILVSVSSTDSFFFSVALQPRT